MSEELVRVEHLKKYFKVSRGILKAVDDVSFSVARGETLGLVGESGAENQRSGVPFCGFRNPRRAACIFGGRTSCCARAVR